MSFKANTWESSDIRKKEVKTKICMDVFVCKFSDLYTK